jgi:heme/copper-type cytochrome/quinol oxidase subunit 3
LADVATTPEELAVAAQGAAFGSAAEPHTVTPDDAAGIHAGHPTVTGISNEKLGMWLFLGSECLLFGGLISTYLLYKNRPGALILQNAAKGARKGSPLRISTLFDIPFTSASSFILLASSLTMVLAVLAASRNERSRLRLWLSTTALLGVLFISGQVYEFTSFVKEGLGYTSNVSSSAFYTLTGFHGVHVTLGIIMLLSCVALTFRARQPSAEAIEIVGLYWHFVDIIWILIFTVVYLIK